MSIFNCKRRITDKAIKNNKRIPLRQFLASLLMEHCMALFDERAVFPWLCVLPPDVIKYAHQQVGAGMPERQTAISILVELDEIEQFRVIKEKIQEASISVITAPTSDE
ncbi:uncharacterized protein LOC143450433 [Clavelina lepadiformis]|uniref:uncharacterized protein LOC143450433 n=1 Tax=Clavelina lepadiformis TaxID=159417 RepID=UPI004041660B